MTAADPRDHAERAAAQVLREQSEHQPSGGPSPFLVGRTGELERLRTLVRLARKGEPAAVVVHGAPGSGKTTLLRAILAESDGFHVLAAEGVESEADLPYAGLADLLAPIQDFRKHIPAPQLEALERALALAEGTVGDRFAVGAATTSLLGLAAERAPLLCAVDDAQWIDAASLEAIRFAARRLAAIGVLVVFVARGDDEPAIDAGGLETLRLHPISPTDAREIVSRVVDAPLDDAVVDQIVVTAGGNPLALVEISAALAATRLRGDPAEPLPPGRSAEELFAVRIAILPERARLALLVMAAAGEDRAATAALARTGLDLSDLEPAEELRLVEVEAGRFAFCHPLIRSVAYHEAAPPERRRAHVAIAATLPAGDLRIPWHLAAAATAPDEAVAAAMDEAADTARRRSGYFAAARAQRRAADLSPDPDARARRLLAAAEDLQIVGWTESARELLDDAVRSGRSPSIHAHALALRGDIELRQGASATACQLLRDAANRMRGDGIRAGVVMMQAAFAALLAGDVDAWRADASDAYVLLRQAGTPLARLAQVVAGIAAVALGEPDAGPELLEAGVDPAGLLVLLRDEAVPVASTAEIHSLAADAWLWLEEWDRAAALLDSLVETLRERAAVTSLIYPLFVRARLDYRLGRWDAALAGASEAVELGVETHHSAPLIGALSVRALISAARGDARGCREDVHRSLELSQHVASPLQAGLARYPRGLLALGGGEIDDAIEHLRLACADWEQAGIVEPGALPFVPDLAEALARGGRAAEAAETIGDYEARALAAGRRQALAGAARVRGLLAPDGSFDKPFMHALTLSKESTGPFERARTLLAYGERLRRARRLTESREPLRDALVVFERLDADPWARRARAELRATGAAVPARSPAVFAELTPHEVQVAQLVAEGRTNREIGAALFIAPKTVEHHLSRVFRKLGIHRRAELAAIAARPAPRL